MQILGRELASKGKGILGLDGEEIMEERRTLLLHWAVCMLDNQLAGPLQPGPILPGMGGLACPTVGTVYLP